MLDKIKKPPRTPQISDEINTRIFELFGLQYFSVKTVLNEGVPRRLPYLRGIYMLFLLLLYSGALSIYLISTQNELNLHVTAKTILTYAIQHSMKIGMFLVILVSLLQSFLSTNKMAQIYDNVRKIVVIVAEDYKINCDFKKIKRKLTRDAILLVVFFAITQISLLVLTSQTMQESIYQMCYLIVIFLLLLIAFKFVFYVQIVNNHLKELNKLLEGIFNIQPARTIEDFNVNLIPVKVSKITDDIFKKFLSAKKIYNILYENGSLLNESMGITMLIVLIILVISLTASGYQIFVILVAGTEKDKIIGKAVNF